MIRIKRHTLAESFALIAYPSLPSSIPASQQPISISRWRSTVSTSSIAPAPVFITTNGIVQYPRELSLTIKRTCLVCSLPCAIFPSNSRPMLKKASPRTLSQMFTLCTISRRPLVCALCLRLAAILATSTYPRVCKRFTIPFTLNMLSRIHFTCVVPKSSRSFSSQSSMLTFERCHAFEPRRK